jgi:hypothetical protein
MWFKTKIGIAIAVISLSLGILPEVDAARISFKCEYRTRDDGRVRSKAKIVVRGLPKGKYFAQIISNGIKSDQSKPKYTHGTQQLEFEFDSDPEDVAFEGKTQIPANFNAQGYALPVVRKFKRHGIAARLPSQQCKIINDDDPDEPQLPPTTPPIDDNPNRGPGGGGNSGSGGGGHRDPD